jgi:hypothetical protein
MNDLIKYTEVTKAVIDAVRNDINTVNKWQTAGANVRGFYGTEAALTEGKAQFIADAILPAIDKRHAAALNVDLPRKGSKDFNALDQSGRDKWEAQNQAKKDARAVAHTMFTRVVSYAFPKEKAESEPQTLKTKFSKVLSDLIGKCEKAENPDFDVVATLGHLKAALAVVTK